MKLEQIVNLIRLVLDKERRGQVKAEDIKIAIQNAERDLYTSLLNILEYKNIVPSLLTPFKGESDVSFTLGKADVSNLGVGYLVSARISKTDTTERYNAFVARNDMQWTGQDVAHLFDENGNFVADKSKYTKSIDGSGQIIEMPSELLRVEGGYVNINGELFPINVLTPDQWANRKLSDFISDPNKPDEPVWLNVEEDLIDIADFTKNYADLPQDVVKMLSFDNLVKGARYEGVVVDASRVNSRSIADLYADDSIIKRHISLIDSEIQISNGIGELPEFFIKDTGVFYNGTNQGTILDSNSFLDRANSNFLTPTEEKPIARIHEGLIEVLPATITSIKLPHYNWPNQKQPVGAIEGGKFVMYPEPEEGVYIKTIKSVTDRMPIAKLVDGAVEVRPFGQNAVTIDYLAYPTDKAPIVRFTRNEPVADGASPVDNIWVRPSSLGYGEVYYIKKIEPSVYAWVVYEREYQFDPLNSVDTMFGDEAVSEIASRALIYLGISKQNSDAAAIDTLRGNAKNKTT